MRMTPCLVLAAALAAPACVGGEEDAAPAPPAAAAAAAPRAEVLDAVPVPGREDARLVDTTGAEDAERRTWLVPLGMDSVAAYYRAALPDRGWRVVGDRGDGARRDLHAVKDGPSLWLQLRRTGPGETELTLIGTDTSPARARDSIP